MLAVDSLGATVKECSTLRQLCRCPCDRPTRVETACGGYRPTRVETACGGDRPTRVETACGGERPTLVVVMVVIIRFVW